MKKMYVLMPVEAVATVEELAYEAGLTVSAYIRTVLMREVRRRQERGRWNVEIQPLLQHQEGK